MSGFRRDRQGVGEILKAAETAAVITAVANNVAAAIDNPDGVDIEVQAYTTDRGAAAVTIADGRGLAMQADKGALTRAAARVGLEVTAR